MARQTALRAAPVGPLTHLDGQTMIESFLSREAARLDGAFLDGVTNRQQWEGRREQLRREYLEMLGLWPLPERTPLQTRVTGALEREEGFRVENLHFQSRPGLYVTGNLYLPKGDRGGKKLPAVLYVCGHSGRGRDGNKTAFQHHGMWFATHGYACLIIDTLQLGEIAAIHHGTYRYDRWWWQARGYTPAAVECWNGIRAIDYLQSRPEIDPERIAITGISGGGAASFWIAAADDRIQVAAPVSGMGDLIDYVGEKVVNGHCDCMFLINTFQWPWTQIAALVAPRPLLFENSGHDPIFPMNGNDRIRSRLEQLYRLYTNRTDRLFDIGITPGGHSDNPELRLMAYRWIDWHLKGSNAPVTERELPPIDGPRLRAFPENLPADELNTKIDESFLPAAGNRLPDNGREFEAWRSDRLAELRRLAFRPLPLTFPVQSLPRLERKPARGILQSAPGIQVAWNYFPAPRGPSAAKRWLVVLNEDEPFDTKPAWVERVGGNASVLLLAPRGTGPLAWQDPPPFAIRRSLALLGRTVEGDRVEDTLAMAASLLGPPTKRSAPAWGIAGRGRAGVIAAYAALFEPRLDEIALVAPTPSHREGPIFLNVLRVLDVPDALGLLAPRALTLHTGQPEAFARTATLYGVAGGALRRPPLP